MYMRHTLLTSVFLLNLLLPVRTDGQPNKITPTPPEAAAIAKAVNFPVSLNTGVPGISVPLGQVDAGGGLILPVSLNYHAGGFKVRERSGRTGLGWSLSTDLQITRTINGKDDFDPDKGYINDADIQPYGSYSSYPNTKLANYCLATAKYDGMPDQFNYSLLNKSGTFYFVKHSGGYYAVPVPYDNIRIQFVDNRFVITDTDGTVYYFGHTSTSNDPGQDVATAREFTNTVVTGWKCVRIEAAVSSNYINFSYASKATENSYSLNDRIEYYNNPSPCDMVNGTTEFFYYPNSSSIDWVTTYEQLTTYDPKFYRYASPKFIEYTNGIERSFNMLWKNPSSGQYEKKQYPTTNSGAAFTPVKGLALASIAFRGGTVQFTGTDNLTGIRFEDADNNTYKSIEFVQSTSSCTNIVAGTQYLDAVVIKGSDNSQTEKYSFLYKDKYCFGSLLKGHDAWGYRNAETRSPANSSSLPMDNLTPRQEMVQNYYRPTQECSAPESNITFHAGSETLDEYPDEDQMQSGILKRIIYPTGGYTDFDYEANRYHHAMGYYKPLLLAGGLRIQKISFYDGITHFKPAWQKYYVYGDLETGIGRVEKRPEVEYVSGKQLYGRNRTAQKMIYAEVPTWTVQMQDPNVGDWIIPCNQASCVKVIAVEDKTTLLPNSDMDLTYPNGSPVYYTKVTEYQQDHGKETGKTVTEYYPVLDFADEDVLVNIPAYVPYTNLRYISTNWCQGALKSVSNYRYSSGKYDLASKKEYTYTKYKHANRPRIVYSYLKNIWRLNGTAKDYYVDYDNTPYGNSNFVRGEYSISSGKLLPLQERETLIEEGSGKALIKVTDYQYNHLPYLQPSSITTTASNGVILTKRLTYPYNHTGSSIYAEMVNRNNIMPVIEQTDLADNSTEIQRIRSNFSMPGGTSMILPSSVEKSFKGNPMQTEAVFDQYDNYGNLLQHTDRAGVVSAFLYGYQTRQVVAATTGIPYATLAAAVGAAATLNNPSSDAALRTVLDPVRSIAGVKTATYFTYKKQIGISSITDINGKKQYYEYDVAGRLLLVKDQHGNILKKHSLMLKTPDNQAFQPYTANSPLMGTANNAYCNSLYADLPGPSQLPRQYIIEGGTNYLSGFITDNTQIVRPQLTTATNTYYATFGCSAGYNYGTVNLGTRLYNEVPEVYVDFTQNGHVVASFNFINSPNNDATRTIYLPPGDYKVSFRPAAGYRGKTLMYSYGRSSDPNFPIHWMETGSTMSIPNGSTSFITVCNDCTYYNEPLLP